MMSKKLVASLAVALLVTIGIVGAAFCQESLNVTGTLTDDFAITTDDGDVYDVVEDEVAIQMFEKTGSRVSASGTLVETDDGTFFKVNTYRIMEE